MKEDVTKLPPDIAYLLSKQAELEGRIEFIETKLGIRLALVEERDAESA